VEGFASQVAAIAQEEGFSVNFHKTRVMRQATRQHLAGVTVNQKPNLKRADLERLEAILFNCVRFGFESQNRDQVPDFRAHLAGRIGFVELVNPAKGARLREMFQHLP
jgi:hypothetical protein